ncbi:MAG: lipopolysaccharide biosynthesis protein [Rubrivivax sp.]|nr:lipopolysaccharide biosynthesis protein [Rubrivivax sp.]
MSVGRSLVLSAADSYIGTALQLASTVVIARVLTPAEIGIFAIASVFAALATMFRDFGVAEYMIQARELSREKIAAALTIQIAASWLMFAAMFCSAPWVASFYRNAAIESAMQVIAFNFVLIPFGAVSMGYFRRELNFAPNLVCNLLGNCVGFAVSVSLALLGAGTMSLAWASLASTATVVAAALWFRPAEVPLWPGLKGIGEVFHFGKFVSGIYIFSQLGKGAPEMIIGRTHGVVDVALFSRASGLVELFHRTALRPVTRVCMPYFARSDRAGASRTAAYTTVVSYLSAVGWPLLITLALVADAAIRLVYGPQWDASVPLARILCVACAVELVHMLAREALLAIGQARQANQLQVRLLVLQVLGLLCVVPYGLHGAAWGILAASAAGLLLSQRTLRGGIGLTVRDMARACAPSAAVTALSVAPLAVWLHLEPATGEARVWAVLAGLPLTGLAWLVALRLFGHPIHARLAERLRAWRAGISRRGGGASA